VEKKMLRFKILGVLSIMAVGACGGENAAPDEGNLGELTVELTTVPPAVRCIDITVRDSPTDPSPETTQFNVTAGQSTLKLTLPRLAAGFYTLSGRAFDVACSGIGSILPSWNGDFMDVQVDPGRPNSVVMNFRQNDPITVDANFIKNVVSVGVGTFETYAVASDGTVWSWGALAANLGNVSTKARQLNGLANVDKVAVGFNFACALMLDGTVSCWGNNARGQLGPNAALNTSTTTPVAVPLAGGRLALDIAAGSQHVCVATSNSGVQCWGDNAFGQLGISPATTFSASPGFITNGGLASRIAAGGETTCMLGNAAVACWGRNDFGQLGTGTTTNTHIPVTLGLTAAVDIAVGVSHACAVLATGAVSCWGSNNAGQLGDVTFTNRSLPGPVTGITNARKIVAGRAHNWVIASDEMSWGWGDNAVGQLCEGSVTNRNRATPRFPQTRMIVAHQGDTTCMNQNEIDGLRCCGTNIYGQLGDGTRDNRFTPTPVVF
jgi:alpha-tubulin suppressor-like RCC1 family protein